ncbi:MAG: flagellar biosynthetic protein FliO [Lysobacter sp.]|nr:flagellar biosynthetic protein FliO [Lysobacter sp.]
MSLVLVLGAAAAAVLFLRRWKGAIGRSGGPMELRHVIALGPRERLALVKVGSRFLVVGVTAAGISRVSEFTDTCLEPAAGGLEPAAGGLDSTAAVEPGEAGEAVTPRTVLRP